MALSIRQLAVSETELIDQLDCTDVIRVRYACERSAGQLALTLRKQSLDPAVAKPDWGKQDRASRYGLWRKNLAQDGCTMLGAFRAERLVGVVLLGRITDGITAEVYALRVHRPERHRGLGTRLMYEAEALAARWACS